MNRAEKRRRKKLAATKRKGTVPRPGEKESSPPPPSVRPPIRPSPHLDIAKTFLKLGQTDEAVESCRAAVEDDPQHIEAWCLLGGLLQQGGELDDAVASYERAVALEPGLVEVQSNLGVAYIALGRNEDAVDSFRAALSLAPDNASVHNNLGVALMNLGRLDEAEPSCRRAISLAPNHCNALNTLGNILTERGRPDEAVPLFQRAIDTDAGYVLAHMNLGRALADLQKFEEARACLQRAVSLQPDFAEAHFNLGIQQLRLGDHENGWANYAWRRHLPSHPLFNRTYEKPIWKGEDLAGRTLYLYNEQGLGDAIQFVRFAAAVGPGGRIVLEVPPSLHRLFENVDGIDALTAKGETTPSFDCHAALMDMPYLLGLSDEGLSRDTPYLSADPALAKAWAERFPADRTLRVGIVWAGNPDHRNDRTRSIPLDLFAPLREIDGVTLYSLQVGRNGEALETLGPDVVDLAPALTDFAHSAGAVSHLDLVITVDTSAAHLAGALGRPVWTLIAATPDWRWGMEGEKTIWYPTMRLFRQSRRGKWDDVIRRVRDALAEEARNRPHRQ